MMPFRDRFQTVRWVRNETEQCANNESHVYGKYCFAYMNSWMYCYDPTVCDTDCLSLICTSAMYITCKRTTWCTHSPGLKNRCRVWLSMIVWQEEQRVTGTVSKQSSAFREHDKNKKYTTEQTMQEFKSQWCCMPHESTINTFIGAHLKIMFHTFS